MFSRQAQLLQAISECREPAWYLYGTWNFYVSESIKPLDIAQLRKLRSFHDGNDICRRWPLEEWAGAECDNDNDSRCSSTYNLAVARVSFYPTAVEG